LTKEGLSVIIEAIIESRKIFQRMKNYCMYACATTVRVVFTFSLLIFIWQYNHPPFMILLMAFINDGTMLTIATDRVQPSETPDAWDLKTIFSAAIAMGLYLSASSLIFFYLIFQERSFFASMGLDTNFDTSNDPRLHSIMFLQVAMGGQAQIFSTRAQTLWFLERPGGLVMIAFCVAQTISGLITGLANWSFTAVQGTGGGWILAIIIWDLIWHIPIDIPKFIGKNIVSEKFWRKASSCGFSVFRYDVHSREGKERITQEEAQEQMARKLNALRLTQGQ